MSFTTTTSTDTQHSADSLNATSDVTITEHLSALLDDEVGSFEQKRVLNELSNNDEIRNKLAHYSLIGETLRSGKSALLVTASTSTSFLAGIQDQLAEEPVYSEEVLQSTQSVSKAKNDSSWLRPVGGFAMAASVAALAVIGFQNYVSNPNLDKPSTEMIATQSMQPNTTDVSTLVNSTDTKKMSLTQAEMESAVIVSADQLSTSDTATATTNATDYTHADLRTRSLLKRYVDSHMQYASTTAFVPSVRVIAYSDY